jgi:fructose transport system ATP-binding protein
VPCGAEVPDTGTIAIEGREVSFREPTDARAVGNRNRLPEPRGFTGAGHRQQSLSGPRRAPIRVTGTVFRKLDRKGMSKQATKAVQDLGITTIQNMAQAVETLSGGQRQAVAVARAAAFGSKIVILDEPTAALGVRGSSMVLELIRRLREQGLSVVLISHNMPHVWKSRTASTSSGLARVPASSPYPLSTEASPS